MYWVYVVIPTLIIGLGVSAYVNGQLKKNSSVRSSLGWTGAEAARRMLAYYGITNVPIRMGAAGQDFYDPRTNSITLSPNAYSTASITALATACHEAGHACQYAQNYAPMKVRGAMVPVVNLCSNGWFIVLLIGIFLSITPLKTLAVILYAAVVLFELVTLPVEFNASNRAVAYIKTTCASVQDASASRKVLTACALTYVAAALTSILQLLWIIGQSRE